MQENDKSDTPRPVGETNEHPDETSSQSGRISRRNLMQGSAASFVGVLLARFGVGETQAKGIDAGGGHLASAQPAGTVMKLPANLSADLVKNVLLTDARGKAFHDYFVARGFEFREEQAQVLMFVNESDPNRKDGAASSPALLMIAPGFSTFSASAPSHESVSIVSIRYSDKVGGVFATSAVVGHNPYILQSFGVGEMDAKNEVVWRSADRDKIQSSTPEELARTVGLPELDEREITAAPGFSEKDLLKTTAAVYEAILKDPTVQALYPSGAIESLLSDTALVQRWSLTQAARYRAASDRIIILCSCSCSCGCSSTSSSYIPSRAVS